MKRLEILSVIAIFIFMGVAWGLADRMEDAVPAEKPGASRLDTASVCPVTKINDNSKCMDCHAVAMRDGKPKWVLKEVSPHAQFKYPLSSNFSFIENEGKLEGHYLMTRIDAADVEQVVLYMLRHPESPKLVIELQNPGGSMMEMWRIIGLMDQLVAAGRIVETRVQGYAASAAFMVFAAGSRGHRFVTPNALLMWHEVMTISFLKIDSPSTTEDEAKVMRMFQDNAHNWLAGRCKLTKAELDERVKRRDWWMDGSGAIDIGIADGYMK